MLYFNGFAACYTLNIDIVALMPSSVLVNVSVPPYCSAILCTTASPIPAPAVFTAFGPLWKGCELVIDRGSEQPLVLHDKVTKNLPSEVIIGIRPEDIGDAKLRK